MIKNLMILTLLIAAFAVFNTSSLAAGNDVMIHVTTYERAKAKAPASDVWATDSNPAFTVGKQLTVADFYNALNDDARTQNFVSRPLSGKSGGSPILYENKQALPFVNAQNRRDELWLGQMISGYVSTNDDFAFLRLDYKEHKTDKPVKSIKDLIGGDGITTNEMAFERVTLALNKVMILASYQAKSGNSAYIAVSVETIKF